MKITMNSGAWLAFTIDKRAGFVALLLPLLVSGCKQKEAARLATPPEVEVVAVEQKDVPIYREWVGTLSGADNATISAEVSGYIVSREYKEGSVVTNGQVLFQIEKGPFAATLARAQAQLAEAQAHKGKTAIDVQRYTPLAATEAISQQELDDAIQADKAAAAQVESSQAAVQSAQLNLGFATIVSPMEGIAGLAQAQVGDLVGPSSGALTTVTRVEPIRVYFSVAQEFMTEIQGRMLAEGKPLRADPEHYEGPPLELTLASGKVYPLKGNVRFANNQIDQKTGTLRVVGEFPNPNRWLLAGMFTRVRAQLGTLTNALLVPQQAVKNMQGRSLVAVVGADDKVSIRPVVTGQWVGPLWVIEGDIKAGDRVVAEGIQKVREGATVKPVAAGKMAATESKAEGEKQ
jgi:membrane fusion protein (multidrug efflux system)